MDGDLWQRVAALEATVLAIHDSIRELRGDIVATHRRLDHLDECLDKQRDVITATTRETMASIERKVVQTMDTVEKRISAAVDFPRRISWLIVTIIVGGFLAFLLTNALKTPESQRTYLPPTTPPTIERNTP